MDGPKRPRPPGRGAAAQRWGRDQRGDDTTRRFEREAILEELTAELVLERYGVDYHRRGGELRARSCPDRADHTRPDTFAVNASSGRWKCHSCGTGGDLFALVAGFEDLDVQREFPRVLALAAGIAGVAPGEPMSDAERQVRAELRRRTEERRAAVERETRAKAEAAVAAMWESLATWDPRGAEYLSSRWLLPIARRSDLVRYDRRGNPCAPLRGSDGRVINVMRRRIDPDANPKVLGAKGCTTVGTFGDWRRFGQTTGHVFVVEGVTDHWTGEALFAPGGNLVLGVNGAARIPWLVERIAPTLAKAKRGLVLVCDGDPPGAEKALEAGRIAIDAGLSREAGALEVFNLGGAHDLNEAALGQGTGDVRHYV